MSVGAVLHVLLVLATPALALGIEEIGTIEGIFDGESCALPTGWLETG